MKKIIAVFLALILGCVGPVTAFAAENEHMYLKIDGIDGITKDPMHAHWIDVLDYTLKTDAEGRVQRFTFTHHIDPATTRILEAYMNKIWIKTARFEACQTFCGKQYTVYTVQIELLKITDVEVFQMEDGSIAETVTLTMESADIIETPIEWPY